MPPTSAHNNRIYLKLRLLVALFLVLPLSQLTTQISYAAAGDLDSTFGVGGKRTTDYFGNDDVASAVAIQPDGKIVTAAAALISGGLGDFGVARYNTDGSPDARGALREIRDALRERP